MQLKWLFCFVLATWCQLAPVSIATADPVTLANTEHFTLDSDRVGDAYLIKIAYPRDYAESEKNYPVLYVTDAETNFGALQYVVQRLAKDKLIPELIVVGIAYDTSYDEFYRLRARDLRPSIPDDPDLDLGGRPDEGEAERFAEFLRHELIPHVDANYRTLVGDRAYYGHSYGGLFGVWSLMYESDLFNRYVILSPSLWWGELWYGRPRISHGYHILPKRAETDGSPETDARVFVASGELEPRIDDQLRCETPFKTRVIGVFVQFRFMLSGEVCGQYLRIVHRLHPSLPFSRLPDASGAPCHANRGQIREK